MGGFKLLLISLAFWSFFLVQKSLQQCTNLPLPIFEVDYEPRGRIVTIAGMDTYETGNLNASRALIGVYDIYGFTPERKNIFQICDFLGDLGYKVILPDFFKGVPWKGEPHPHPDSGESHERATSWDESVRADLFLTLEEYKRQNISEFGIFGFCFGGKISAYAVGEYYYDIRVAAQFHPAGMNLTDAAQIRRPSILLPGANDPDMTEYCSIINRNLGQGSCVYHHFLDVNHGFSGSASDWNNCTALLRAQDAVQMFTEFLCTHFPVI